MQDGIGSGAAARGPRPAAPGRRAAMLTLALGHLLACTVSLGGCGGGGAGGPESAPAVLPAVASAAAAPQPGGTQSASPGAGTSVVSAANVANVANVANAGSVGSNAGSLAFSFTLASERSTSAGVFAADGSLVRTLWRGERIPAGTTTRSWDRRDDGGKLLPDADYTVKVAHHDLRYVWEGVIGNTSAAAGAAAPHRAFQVPTSLAAGAGRMHYAVGYNEAQSGIHGFDLAQPQNDRSAVQLNDPFVAASMIAGDGQRLYWANTGGLAKKSFIGVFDIASGTQAAFSSGAPLCLNTMNDRSTCYPAQAYKSVIEARDNLDSPPTGIAVQRDGRILAVAYGAENAVRLYDKLSGRLLQVLSVRLASPATAASNQIAMAPGGDLWVLSGGSALRYTALGTAPSLVATTGLLTRPLAITVDPHDDDAVWVADGGASQQLKRFDRFGAVRQTLGRPGGFDGGSQVVDDRLCFQNGPNQEQTALAVDDDRALWVVDTCNNRMLKLAADGRVADQIAYLPVVYVSTVDSANPTRVFANYLEFAVDYGKSLGSPGAWKLVRNWLPALPAALRDADSANRGWGGFRTVQTLSNGRTYGLLNVSGRQTLVELTAAGAVRPVTTLRPPAAGETAPVLYENGDLGYALTENGRQAVLRLPLVSFDGQGNPVWAGSAVTLASAPFSAAAPTYPSGTFSGVLGPRFPVTSSGSVIFFNPAVDAASGFHLGGVARGATNWAWQASPSGPLDGHGSFQTRRDDAGIQYGGNTVMAVGRSVVYGYHGEFYTDLANRRVGQANQFMHFLDDGLFIGQFGVASTQATAPSQPGLSGNAFSPTLVLSGGRTYLYHNDESSHGGVQRWRLEGAADIQELVGSGSLPATITLR